MLRVGTVIFALMVVLWFLSTYPGPPDGATGAAIECSMAGMAAREVAVVKRETNSWRYPILMAIYIFDGHLYVCPGLVCDLSMNPVTGALKAMTAQQGVVAVIVLGCTVYAAWVLMPTIARRFRAALRLAQPRSVTAFFSARPPPNRSVTAVLATRW